MAEINVAANNKEAAIQDLRKALDLTPDLVVAQRGLILLYLDARKFEDAQRVAGDVKKQRPTEAVGYLLEGDIAASRKAWIEALSAYRAGLQAVPATELAVKVYTVLLATNKNDEAEKFASRWFTDHPKDAGFRLAVAESATARRDYPTAVRHYQALLQSQPNNPIILNNVAWALGQLKDPKALDYSERANRIAPNQPAIMETLGTLLAEKGEVTRALEVLQKAVELAPQSPALKLSLARAQIKAGKKSEARKQLDELAKLGDKFAAQAEVAKLSKELAN
jgi:putative PEP-CTERM system TPR-repeat lipoprotein